MTKGLSKIGFNADVFLGKFDDNKYVKSLEETQAQEEKLSQKETAMAEIAKADSREAVTAIWVNNPGLKSDDEFKAAIKAAGEKFPAPPPSEPEPEPTQDPGQDAKGDF
jgi:hypothetical protein